jgi:hypothetical protein
VSAELRGSLIARRSEVSSLLESSALGAQQSKTSPSSFGRGARSTRS